MCEAVDARDVVPGGARVHEHERARDGEPRGGEREADSGSAPAAVAGDEERHDEQHPRILRGRGEPRGDARPLEPIRDEQRQAHGHADGQQDVRDRHPRVRDVRRRDGDPDGAGQGGGTPVRHPPEPPRRGHADEADRDRHDPRGPVRRGVEPDLGRARAGERGGSGSRTSRGRARRRGRAPTRAGRCSSRRG